MQQTFTHRVIRQAVSKASVIVFAVALIAASITGLVVGTGYGMAVFISALATDAVMVGAMAYHFGAIMAGAEPLDP